MGLAPISIVAPILPSVHITNLDTVIISSSNVVTASASNSAQALAGVAARDSGIVGTGVANKSDNVASDSVVGQAALDRSTIAELVLEIADGVVASASLQMDAAAAEGLPAGYSGFERALGGRRVGSGRHGLGAHMRHRVKRVDGLVHLDAFGVDVGNVVAVDGTLGNLEGRSAVGSHKGNKSSGELHVEEKKSRILEAVRRE